MIGVVQVGIGRRLEIRGREEGQPAGGGIDGEITLVRSSGKGEGYGLSTGLVIGGENVEKSGEITFVMDVRRGKVAVQRSNDGRFVDFIYSDGDRPHGLTPQTVRHLDDDVVTVDFRGIVRSFEIRKRLVEEEPSSILESGGVEIALVLTAHERIMQGVGLTVQVGYGKGWVAQIARPRWPWPRKRLSIGWKNRKPQETRGCLQ